MAGTFPLLDEDSAQVPQTWVSGSLGIPGPAQVGSGAKGREYTPGSMQALTLGLGLDPAKLWAVLRS